MKSEPLHLIGWLPWIHIIKLEKSYQEAFRIQDSLLWAGSYFLGKGININKAVMGNFLILETIAKQELPN